MIPLQIVFEDELSETVIMKLLSCFGKYTVTASYNKHGSGNIKKEIRSYNNAAKYFPFFILTDLDQKDCPLTLIKEWCKFKKHPHLIFRIAVKEVESWLLADREGFAKYTAVSVMRIPNCPDNIDDPKELIFSIIKKSPKRILKDDILPRYDGDRIGPNYNGRLSEFVDNYWEIKRAIQHSPSLKKAYNHLNTFSVS
jgi:hypothetical protein